MQFHAKNAIGLAALALLPFSPTLVADERDGAPTPLTPPTVLHALKPHQTDENRQFQGIPGLERASNGRLWAVWYGGDRGEGNDNIVMLNTSGDDGATWSDLKIVIDIDRPIRCFDPVVWIDPTQRLWLFWGQAITHGDNAHTWAMITENPEDENPVWAKPFPIAPGVMMNKPTVLESGEWLLPISDWEGRRLNIPDKATANVTVTKDQGKTFEALGGVHVPVPVRHFDEQMVVQRKDGSLLMFIRTQYGIGEAISTDGGKTWSEIAPSKVTHPSARFFIRRLRSGNLLLVKHWPIDKKLSARDNLTAFVSKDDGLTWEGGLLLDEREHVSYPDGIEGDDGIIRIIYDYSRHSEKEILMAAFTEEDVLAKEDVSGKVRLRVLVNKASGIHFTDEQLRSNEDGSPLIQGTPAEWKTETGEIREFKQSAPVFSDQPDPLLNVPEPLKGSRFIYGTQTATRAVCTRDGICYVITPSEGRSENSLHAELLEKGFTKAAVKEFLLYNVPPRAETNLMSTYQKSFKAGDELNLGKWGIILAPKAN
jgi:predicted neuraminidase